MDVPEYVESRIKDVALDLCIDPVLLRAILEVESGFDKWAVRFEMDFTYIVSAQRFARLNKITHQTEIFCQKCSWGMGQIMGGTARDFGFHGPLPELLDPDTNIFWCGMVLKKKVLRWPNLKEHISAYNAGSPSKMNPEYVAKVLKAMKQ